MMPLKLQAWVDDQYMIPVSGYSGSGESIRLVYLAGRVPSLNTRGAWYAKTPTNSVAISRVVLRHYTGLKDKDAVEIYEGDIVNYRGKSYEVVFKRGAFGVHIDSRRPGPSFSMLGLLNYQMLQVVGNVYQHPELRP